MDMAKRPGGEMLQNLETSHSEMMPLLSKWKNLGNKGFFIPVALMLILTLYVDSTVNWICALAISGGTVFMVYRMCGKAKSSIAIVGSAMMTFLVVTYCMTPFSFVFENLLPGDVGDPNTWAQRFTFPELLFHLIFAAGMREELVKILPVILAIYLARHLRGKNREEFGVFEPLDGILLAAASAAGFALSETMLQYVPQNTNIHSLDSLNMVVFRLAGDITGHVAYSGYLGYMVGLAIMKPKDRWRILAWGYGGAALLHSLWDACSAFYGNDVLFVIGALSYAAMATAIFKAREISPNRVLLKPSIVFGQAGQAVKAGPAAIGEPARVMAAAAAAAPSPMTENAMAAPLVMRNGEFQRQLLVPQAAPQLPAGSLSLRIGMRQLVVVAGLRLLPHQVAGLKPQSIEAEAVAEVTRNPQDPNTLGLRNLSSSTWEVVNAQGNRREIQPGQAVRLAAGTKIDFGKVDGEVA
jgi:RsiW-degrading membrane proteinase PrsW (M82 family)